MAGKFLSRLDDVIFSKRPRWLVILVDLLLMFVVYRIAPSMAMALLLIGVVVLNVIDGTFRSTARVKGYRTHWILLNFIATYFLYYRIFLLTESMGVLLVVLVMGLWNYTQFYRSSPSLTDSFTTKASDVESDFEIGPQKNPPVDWWTS
jgi:hypothetical protein